MFVRRIARPLLSAVFISQGIDALRNPGGRARIAEPVIDLIDREVVQPAAQKVAAGAAQLADDAASSTADVAEGHPDEVTRNLAGAASSMADDAAEPARRVAIGGLDLEDEAYVRINGAVQVGAGVLLALGRAPRLASVALAASIVPTTLAGHRFWELEGDERHEQQVHFLKNASLLGGLILAAVDTEGQPGLAWKARHLRGDGGALATAAAANAKLAGRAARADARAAKRLAAANAKVAGSGAKLGAEVVGERVAKVGHQLHDRAVELAPVAQDAATTVHDRAAELGRHLHERAAELAPIAQERVAEVLPQVQAKATDLAARAGVRA